MIKITKFSHIQNATDDQLNVFFSTNTIKDTAKLIEVSAAKLGYYLRNIRNLNFKNHQKKSKTAKIKSLTKDEIIEELKTLNASGLAQKYNVSNSTITIILKKHNINLIINKINKNKNIISINRKEFIKKYCVNCHLWTANKNISFWNPCETDCLKYCVNEIIERLQIKVNFAYNKNNDTIFYIAYEQNILKLAGWKIE